MGSNPASSRASLFFLSYISIFLDQVRLYLWRCELAKNGYLTVLHGTKTDLIGRYWIKINLVWANLSFKITTDEHKYEAVVLLLYSLRRTNAWLWLITHFLLQHLILLSFFSFLKSRWRFIYSINPNSWIYSSYCMCVVWTFNLESDIFPLRAFGWY